MFFKQGFLDKILLTKELESSKYDLHLERYQPAIEALKREEYTEAIEQLNSLIPGTLENSNIKRLSIRSLLLYFYPKKRDRSLLQKKNVYTYYLRGVAHWMKSLNQKNKIEMSKEREESIRDFKEVLWILEILDDADFEQSINASIRVLTSPPLFSHSFQELIRAIAKAKIQEIKSLKLVNKNTLSNLRKHEIQLASVELNVILEKLKANEFIQTLNKSGKFLLYLAIILVVIFSYVLPAKFFATLGKFDFSIFQWFLLAYSFLILSLLPFAPLFPLFGNLETTKKNIKLNEYLDKRLFEISFKKRFSRQVKIFIALTWFLGLETMYVLLLLKALNGKFQINFVSFLFLSGTQALVIYFLALILSIIVFLILQRIFFLVPATALIRSYQINSLTYSLIASKLSRVMVLGAENDWKNITDRNEIIRSLTQVSILFKVGNLQKFSIKNKYVSDRYSSISNYIETLTLWVALPKKDTKQYFCVEIKNILNMFLIGDWDALVNLSAELSEADLKLSKKLNFSFLFRSLLSAMLPLASVLLFGSYIKESKVFGFSYELVLLATSYWAVISLLTILDPELHEKIKASQGFFEIFNKFLPGNIGKKPG